MTSTLCRHINCPNFGKFSGKACCRLTHPKRFIKHLTACPLTLQQKEQP